MESFLQEQIAEIFTRHEKDLDEIVVIIPNKRASVYIYKYLSELSGRALFPPRIITINEWIDENTPQRILSQTELLFLSYQVHQQIEGDSSESFDDFIKWAPILISDLDEVDRNLIDHEQIFKNLRDVKKIENWSFERDELSEGQSNFMAFWDKIPVYYKLIKEELDRSNCIYQGAAYRQFFEKINHQNLKGFYYFIGFNALSKSENAIMRYLQKNDKAAVKFDMDRFYFDNPAHEAGHFYRAICKNWDIQPSLSDHLNTAKEIKIIETSQQIAQAQIAGNIISELIKSGANLSSTVVVLADESLLIPLLNALPPNLEKANVTMGYPIRYSHLKSLVDLLFDLQFNYQKFSNRQLYYRNFLNLLTHPYIDRIVGNSEQIEKLESQIIDHNAVFLSWEEIENKLPGIERIRKLFLPWNNPFTEGFQAFDQLALALHTCFDSDGSDDLDIELLNHFMSSLDLLKDLSHTYNYSLSLRSFKQLFYKFWQRESLSFLGNPVDGVQIMGILETRTLDFENVIILGMNEGVLPQVNISNSFIPFDIKRFYELPVEADREAIFAHHFYRLLHRANRVWMTYNSSGEGLSNSEQSRYIIQLENELNAVYAIERFTYSAKDKGTETKDLSYRSTAEVHKKLDELFLRGLSPSALNKLIECPLNFYYRYVLEMKEDNEVEENIEVSTFGTNIHNVLERIMTEGFIREGKNLPLEAGVLKTFLPRIEEMLIESYTAEDDSGRNNFSRSDLKFGQNKLSLEVSVRLIKEFVEEQIRRLKSEKEEVHLVTLEEELTATFDWDIGGSKKTINLMGKADRIDRIGNVYHIIDYKSGKCSTENIKLNKSFFQEGGMTLLMEHEKKKYCRQLLMYGLMFRQKYADVGLFTAGIISMINISDWLQNVYEESSGNSLISSDTLDLFENELREKIATLYSPEFIFQHNPKAKYCEHCEN